MDVVPGMQIQLSNIKPNLPNDAGVCETGLFLLLIFFFLFFLEI